MWWDVWVVDVRGEGIAFFYLSLSLVYLQQRKRKGVKCRGEKERERVRTPDSEKRKKREEKGKDRFIVALSECKFKMTKRNVTGADTNDWVAWMHFLFWCYCLDPLVDCSFPFMTLFSFSCPYKCNSFNGVTIPFNHPTPLDDTIVIHYWHEAVITIAHQSSFCHGCTCIINGLFCASISNILSKFAVRSSCSFSFGLHVTLILKC